MLRFIGRPHRYCDGLNRRSFLKVGSLGLGGLALPQLLELRAAAATAPGGSSRASVIFVDLAGGPSQFETYDPKPDAPVEFRGSLDTVATRLPGVRFSQHMVEQAAVMDKLAIIRSVHHQSSSHQISSHLIKTGYFPLGGKSEINEMPSAGSICARLRGSRTTGLPPYVSVLRSSHGNAAWLGKAYNPFAVDSDPNAADFKVRNLTLAGQLAMGQLEDRRRLLAEFDRLHRMLDLEGETAALDQFSRQAFELITSDQARKAFDLGSETQQTRDAYGRTTFGQSMLLARRLVEAGVTFVTLSSGGWDHHGQLARYLPTVAVPLDRALAALVRDLSDRGLDRDVLVVAMGEFGRTPRVNVNAGRDHWGALMSVLVAGGGLRMGQVIGSSNSKGEFPVDRPYRPENVLATVYRHLGIDPSTTFRDLNGRPRYILEEREIVRELV